MTDRAKPVSLQLPDNTTWDGSVTTNPSALSVVGNGQNTVASAGTAEPLTSTQDIVAVTIKSLSTNTDSIWVGDSGVDSSNGFELLPTDGVTILIDDPSKVYIDAGVSGEGVSFILLS